MRLTSLRPQPVSVTPSAAAPAPTPAPAPQPAALPAREAPLPPAASRAPESSGLPRAARRAELTAAAFSPPRPFGPPPASPLGLRDARALNGTRLDTAFPTLTSALSAARAAQTDDAVFVVTRRGARFDVLRYAPEGKRVALADVAAASLPWGAAGSSPQTWVLDAHGELGQLVLENKDGAKRPVLDAVNPRFVTEPRAPAGSGLPAVTPTPQTNHSKNVRFSPAYAFRPSADLDELARVVRFVNDHLPAGTKIKAGGSLHAYSDVAATAAVFLHPEHMKGIAALPSAGAAGDTLRASVGSEQRRQMVEVVAGTTIAELNDDLWGRGLSIPNLGGYDGQTVAGVLATGTHGSALSRGPLIEMVQATTLVRADGSKVRVEPQGGISDPDAFRAQHPDVELIQDDDVFAASLVHNGMLGVVHSHVLAVTDAFHLREVRTLSDAATVKGVLKDGGVYALFEGSTPAASTTPSPLPGHPAQNFHLEFWFNPHSDAVAVTSRNKVKLDAEPVDMSKRPGRDLLEALRLGGTWTRPLLPTWLTENVPELVGGTTAAVARLVPKATPWLIDQAMAILPDREYVQRGHNVFNIGDGANAIPALSSTVFVPLRDDLYLKALDVLKDTAARFAAEGKYQAGPISLRFVKGSDAALGVGEDVASFELIFADGTPHASEMTAAYYQALRDQLGDNVTYHWGQYSPGLSAADVASNFPKLETFQRVQRAFDPGGTFLNETQERLFTPTSSA